MDTNDTRQTGHAKRYVQELRIIIDYNYDRNFYIKQDKTGIVTSLNFWHGAEDIDYGYSENCPDLLKEFQREWFAKEDNEEFIDILNKAAEIYLIKKNKDWRKPRINDIVESMIQVMFIKCQEACHCDDGGITPEQTFELDIIKERLKELIGEQITQNL
jgi:hypothetical protein